MFTIVSNKLIVATCGIAFTLFTAPPAQANDGCHILYERYDQSDRIVVPNWEVMKLTFMSCKATSAITDRSPATDMCHIRNIMNRGILFYIILAILLCGLVIIEIVRMTLRRNTTAQCRLPRVPKSE